MLLGGVATAGGTILLLIRGGLDLFNELVDKDDDCVLSSKLDRSNSERGTRMLVSNLDMFVASVSAEGKQKNTIACERIAIRRGLAYLWVEGIGCILLRR